MNATLVSDLELQARQLLAVARGENWSPVRAAVLNVFEACWSRALSGERVQKIAEALEGVAIEPEARRAVLTALVRERFLRSRLERGERLYEVNLK